MAKQGEPSETMAIAESAKIQLFAPANNFDIFHLFPDLPPELRSMVIKVACFIPRNVSLWQKQHHGIPIPTRGGQGPDIFAHSYKTTSRVPAILHASKELRTEGLRWYDVSFGTNMGTGDVRFVDPPKIYINWKADRLCLMEPSSIVRVGDSDDPLLWDLPGANNLKTLALNFGICNKQIANIIGARIRESDITTVGIFNTRSREPRPHPEFKLESFLYVGWEKGAKPTKGLNSALKFLLPIKANFDVFGWEQEERLEAESKNSSGVGKEIVLRPRPRIELLRYTAPKE